MNALQILFVISVIFAFYTVVGYPVLLALLVRLRPKSVRKSFAPRTVSVILPVRNGGHWIDAKIRSLVDQRYPPQLVDIIVISDGSTDKTDDIVRSFASSGR